MLGHKYGIALAEVSLEDLGKFDVVTIPRSQMTTIVTDLSEPIQDGTGQVDPVPIAWANGWIVESANWTEELTTIINNGRNAYNAKYPAFPIPENTVLIW